MNTPPRLTHLAIRYGLAIFSSAFLLFQVQPLLGNYILPWFGGSSSVWTGCLLFFQTVLVLGYGYAHLLSRLPIRRQAIIHLAVLAGSILVLPITPSETWKPTGAEGPVEAILLLLTLSVGIPYLVLASTGPLLQSWFAWDSRGASPYRLFALSNAASLLGLITYPFLVQPNMPVDSQTVAWSVGYGAFALAVGLCAVFLFRTAGPGVRESLLPGGPLPSRGTRALWLLLPACASLLLLGITNQLTSEVAAVPFLWVLPLVLYLLSFIISFERPAWYERRVFVPLLALAVFANTMIVPLVLPVTWQLHIIVSSLSIFAAAMVCHGELVRLRPGHRHLTAFYLTISIGGALGGVFVAVIAPLVFPGFWEVPLGLFACLLLLLTAMGRDPASLLAAGRETRARGWIAVGLGLGGPLLMGVPLLSLFENDVQVRTFYGVHQIDDKEAGTPSAHRLLSHGITQHGAQFLSETRRSTPVSYYGAGSGVQLAIDYHPRRLAGEPLRIGVVGLGAGVLAAYGRPGDTIQYYELDPEVESIARAYFTYLDDSPAEISVALGDGRLSLVRENLVNPERLDILVVDAFAGGSIPVHLLTRESFEVYRAALGPEGVLAIHVSNKYLRLAPVVRGSAAASGSAALQVFAKPDTENLIESSHWVLVAADPTILKRPVLRDASEPWNDDHPPVLWTDRKSSLLQVLR